MAMKLCSGYWKLFSIDFSHLNTTSFPGSSPGEIERTPETKLYQTPSRNRIMSRINDHSFISGWEEWEGMGQFDWRTWGAQFQRSTKFMYMCLVLFSARFEPRTRSTCHLTQMKSLNGIWTRNNKNELWYERTLWGKETWALIPVLPLEVCLVGLKSKSALCSETENNRIWFLWLHFFSYCSNIVKYILTNCFELSQGNTKPCLIFCHYSYLNKRCGNQWCVIPIFPLICKSLLPVWCKIPHNPL